MGLLDEAIREHLELMRRRGADPSTIAREEREALAPVFPDELEGPDGDGSDSTREGPGAAEIALADVSPEEYPRHEDDRHEDPPTRSEETAELDMQAAMEEDPDAADGGSPVGPIVENSLELEAQREQDRAPVPEDVPGQERLSFE